MNSRQESRGSSIKRAALGSVVLWLLFSSVSFAERIALVIGNGNYADLYSLNTPVNDARAMATVLEQSGFSVTLLTDASGEALRSALDIFAEKAAEESVEVVLVYFSGHAFQKDGENHLVPSDLPVDRLRGTIGTAVPLDSLLERLSHPARPTLAFIEITGANPLPESVTESQRDGLAPVKLQENMLVALPAQPGRRAAHGSGPLAPFTEALTDEIANTVLPLSALLELATDAVEDFTFGRQTPWSVSTLKEPVALGVAAKPRPLTQEELHELSALPDDLRVRFTQEELDETGRYWRNLALASIDYEHLGRLYESAQIPVRADMVAAGASFDWWAFRNMQVALEIADRTTRLGGMGQPLLPKHRKEILDAVDRVTQGDERYLAIAARLLENALWSDAEPREGRERHSDVVVFHSGIVVAGTGPGYPEPADDKPDAGLEDPEVEEPNGGISIQRLSDHSEPHATPDIPDGTVAVLTLTRDPREMLTGPDLYRSLQKELLRLGCFDGAVSGLFGPRSTMAVARYRGFANLEEVSLKPTASLLIQMAAIEDGFCGSSHAPSTPRIAEVYEQVSTRRGTSPD